MGVTYKLTEEIVQFILEQKKNSADLSCRELVEQIAVKYGKTVSKSSVHDVLKHANITSSRGRKPKNKFQIPQEKKAQLMAQLLSIIEPAPVHLPAIIPPAENKEAVVVEEKVVEIEAALNETVEELKEIEKPEQATLLPDPTKLKPAEAVIIIPEALKALEESEIRTGAGEVFLGAAFADIFPSPWGEVKSFYDLKSIDSNALYKELEYRKLQASHYKVELEDGCVFYVDCRLQGVSGQNNRPYPAPIERALADLADFLLNNLQPIVIKEFVGESLGAAFFDMVGAFDCKSAKAISKVTLVDVKGEILADFGGILAHHRDFLIGISPQVIDIKYLVEISDEPVAVVSSYFFTQPLRFVVKNFNYPGGSLRACLILGHGKEVSKVILSNCSVAVKDADLVRMYFQRHPTGHLRPPPRLPINVSKEAPEEYLVEYAKVLIGDTCSTEIFNEIIALKGKTAFNNNISVVTLFIPSGYSNIDSLLYAIEMVNILGLKDEFGRQIWVKTATENGLVI